MFDKTKESIINESRLYELIMIIDEIEDENKVIIEGQMRFKN